MRRLTGLFLLLLAFGMGASNTLSRGADTEEPPALTPAELEAERLLGNSVSATTVQSSVLLVAPELETRLLEIADRLAKVTGVKRPIHVFILNLPVSGAWTVPNGDILISTGILTLAENVDEVAVLLGHEIAHLHFHDGYVRQAYALSAHRTVTYIAMLVSGAVAGAGASAAGTGLSLIQMPNILLQELFDELVVNTVADWVGRLLANMTSATAVALLTEHLSGYSQNIELRADRYAVRLAARAGFDARRGSKILQKLRDIQNRAQASGTASGGP